MMSHRGVCLVRRSGNHKTGRVTALYQSMISCPPNCPLRGGKGCYGECGKVQMVEMRLTRQARAEGMDALALAHEAAAQLEREAQRRPAGEPMRVNVVGDCASPQSAAIVSTAVERWMDSTGQRAWGYTHAAADVPRYAWGRVSILASCETPLEIVRANRSGYATATVNGLDIAGELRREGLTVLPCPSQTKGIHCVQCRLCMKDDLLRERGLVISFEAHGSRTRHCSAAVAAKRGDRHDR